MSNYTVTTNFGAKDSLPSGNAAKVIKGSEFTTEFTNIQTAIATKADTAGDTFTGAVTFDAAVTLNADVTFDTNTLFVDVSANRVGIGNVAPATALDVTGVITTDGLTSSAGIDVTGTVTASGLTVDTDTLYVDATNDRVGIGTDSPLADLHVSNGTNSDSTPVEFMIGGTANSVRTGSIVKGTTSGAYDLTLQTSNHATANQPLIIKLSDATEAMRIDSSGNVGIGTTNPDGILHAHKANAGADTAIMLENSGQSGTSTASLVFTGNGGTGQEKARIKSAVYGDGYMAFHTNDDTEKMRIDSSGNVLVGKTSTAFGTAGSVSYATGLLTATVDGNACVQLNRLTSDGVIQTFGKDGTTVGSIGTTGGDMYVGTGDTGIRFDDATNHIRPCGVNGANLDAAIDIGDSTRRFKDLYLSGGIKGSTLTFSGNGSSEHARIDSSGNLLVGTTSQISSGKLSVAGGASANGITATTAATSGYTVASFQRTASDGQAVQFKRGAAEVGSISLTSSATAYNTSSDQRLKENIQDSADAGSKIDAIQIRQFDWKSDGSHQDYGVIAQELLEVAPEAVTEGETEDDMMSVDYSKLVPTLIKEIQTLRNRVAQLEKN